MAEAEAVRAGAPADGAEPLVVMRGKWIALRTLLPSDLGYLTEWSEDPHLEKMVGSEFLHAYKHQYDKHPSFYDAVLNDPTQVVFMIEAHHGWDRPVGLIEDLAYTPAGSSPIMESMLWGFDGSRPRSTSTTP